MEYQEKQIRQIIFMVHEYRIHPCDICFLLSNAICFPNCPTSGTYGIVRKFK